jgi:hypothetical protein
MPFFQGLRLVMSHGPYVKLIAGFLFTSLAFMVSGVPEALSLGVVMGVGLERTQGVMKLRDRTGGVGEE